MHPEECGERLDVDRVRRRNDHDLIAGGQVGLQAGQGVAAQPVVVDLRRELGGQRFDNPERAAGEGGPCGEHLERVPVTADERPRHVDRMGGDAGDEPRRAGYLPEERHHAITSGERSVEIERGDARHVRRAGIESSASQNPGQLFETTAGVDTSMPSTTSPSSPNAIANR